MLARIKAFFVKYWKAAAIIGAAVFVLLVVLKRRRDEASSGAIVEIDKEKAVTKQEAARHRAEAEGRKKLAESAVKRMKELSEEARENGNPKLADVLARW